MEKEHLSSLANILIPSGKGKLSRFVVSFVVDSLWDLRRRGVRRRPRLYLSNFFKSQRWLAVGLLQQVRNLLEALDGA
jgi:hypothetical protein